MTQIGLRVSLVFGLSLAYLWPHVLAEGRKLDIELRVAREKEMIINRHVSGTDCALVLSRFTYLKLGLSEGKRKHQIESCLSI